MSSQKHGKIFEERIQKSLGYEEVSNTQEYDIPSDYHPDKLPMHIKLIKNNSAICMSDARRIWSQAEQRRVLLVGFYNQKGSYKYISEIYEIMLTAEMKRDLFGSVSLEEVKQFHEGIKSFSFGKHTCAREYAKSQKKKLSPFLGIVQLNPKIDSQRQRRLQCSISKKDFVNLIKKYPECLNIPLAEFGEVIK